MVKRLWKHLVSIVSSTLLTILSNIVLVPIFLARWTPAAYGEWLVLSSVTAYLATLDFGMNSAVGNRMLASYTKNDLQDYKRCQHSAMAFYVSLALAASALTALAVTALPVAHWMGLKLTAPGDAAWIIWLLSLQVLWAMPVGLLSNTYRTLGEPSRTQWINNVRLVLTMTVTVTVLLSGGTMKTMALCQLLPTLLIALGVLWNLSRRVPELLPSFSLSRISTIREIIKPSLWFALIMAAMAITQQGSVLVVSAALGGVAVALFAVTRTLTNVAMQIVNIIKNAAWPDLTILFAQDDKERLRAVVRLLLTASMTICIAVAAALFFEGPEIIRVWTHHKLHADRPFLGLFLLYLVLQAPWIACSGLMLAVNRHQRLSLSYLASGVLGITFAALLCHWFGLAGVPAGLILGEALACYHFVVKDACEIIGESYPRLAARIWLGGALVLLPTLAAGGLMHQIAWGPAGLRWAEVGVATTLTSCLVAWWACFGTEERAALQHRAGLLAAKMGGRRVSGQPA